LADYDYALINLYNVTVTSLAAPVNVYRLWNDYALHEVTGDGVDTVGVWGSNPRAYHFPLAPLISGLDSYPAYETQPAWRVGSAWRDHHPSGTFLLFKRLQCQDDGAVPSQKVCTKLLLKALTTCTTHCVIKIARSTLVDS
jgi:hypothetical protein